MANKFTAQTVAATSQAVSCLSICEDSKELLPDQFEYLLIDALQRLTGVSIAAISSADLKQAIADAECSLGGLRLYASSTPKVRQQVLLFLVNRALGG